MQEKCHAIASYIIILLPVRKTVTVNISFRGHQDALEKIRQTSGQLKDQLADQREKFTGEIHAMQANFVDEKHRWETDRNELQDQLSRVSH